MPVLHITKSAVDATERGSFRNRRPGTRKRAIITVVCSRRVS